MPPRLDANSGVKVSKYERNQNAKHSDRSAFLEHLGALYAACPATR